MPQLLYILKLQSPIISHHTKYTKSKAAYHLQCQPNLDMQHSKTRRPVVSRHDALKSQVLLNMQGPKSAWRHGTEKKICFIFFTSICMSKGAFTLVSPTVIHRVRIWGWEIDSLDNSLFICRLAIKAVKPFYKNDFLKTHQSNIYSLEIPASTNKVINYKNTHTAHKIPSVILTSRVLN